MLSTIINIRLLPSVLVSDNLTPPFFHISSRNCITYVVIIMYIVVIAYIITACIAVIYIRITYFITTYISVYIIVYIITALLLLLFFITS